ncbi:MAG: hypothetical protein WBA54_08360 [Acidaminobacteraceae bacterium]
MREEIIKENMERYLSIKKWSYILQVIVVAAILYFGYTKSVLEQGTSIYSIVGVGIIALLSLSFYIYKDIKLKKNIANKNLKAVVLKFETKDVNQLFRRPRLKIKELNKSYEILLGIEINKFDGKKVTVVYDDSTKMILDIY